MNLSNTGSNFTTAVYRDTLNTAIMKNVITVVLCISINYVNSTLVYTFTKHQVFNVNPRYILYIHLVINDIVLLSLFTLLQVLSYIVYTLNVSLCIVLLMIATIASLNNPLTLAFMAVECYIAICLPLHHTQICTVRKTYVVIGLIWAISILSILPDLFVALATEPLQFFRSRVFCLRDNVFRDPNLTVKRDVSNSVCMVIVWLTLFYTYFWIMFAAKAAATDAKKARNTVLLHGFQLLLCMLTYVFHLIIQGLTYLFPNEALAIRFTASIFIQVLPRLISPVVYGLRDKTFRNHLKRYLFCTTSASTHPQTTQKQGIKSSF
ncbi:odorant receptor 131-2-like [Perca fluviatilis]|uniref:odorant receptor 131-2-like n=1 Tax=Perca fluviatilis TaxID=8168 RepID=UPI0019631732|nr:odorant receptor 131-2-like [Perca fluviatilis]